MIRLHFEDLHKGDIIYRSFSLLLVTAVTSIKRNFISFDISYVVLESCGRIKFYHAIGNKNEVFAELSPLAYTGNGILIQNK